MKTAYIKLSQRTTFDSVSIKTLLKIEMKRALPHKYKSYIILTIPNNCSQGIIVNCNTQMKF